MLLIALLAIIGGTINAGVGYWIVFGFYCFFWAIGKIIDIAAKLDKKKEGKTYRVEYVDYQKKGEKK